MFSHPSFSLASVLGLHHSMCVCMCVNCFMIHFALQELEEQLAEQKKLLQSVASRGEEILIQQASPSSSRYVTLCLTVQRLCAITFTYVLIFNMFPVLCSTTEPFSPEALVERESQAAREQMRQRWESLRLELKTKLQLLQKTLEQDHKQPVQTRLCRYLVLITC